MNRLQKLGAAALNFLSSPTGKTLCVVACGVSVLCLGASGAFAAAGDPPTAAEVIAEITGQVYPGITPAIGAAAVPFGAKWIFHTVRGLI